MNARIVLKKVVELGGAELRQRGSHVRVACRCGRFLTVVPDHGSKEIPPGTLRAIERDLEPCFGKGWLRRS